MGPTSDTSGKWPRPRVHKHKITRVFSDPARSPRINLVSPFLRRPEPRYIQRSHDGRTRGSTESDMSEEKPAPSLLIQPTTSHYGPGLFWDARYTPSLTSQSESETGESEVEAEPLHYAVTDLYHNVRQTHNQTSPPPNPHQALRDGVLVHGEQGVEEVETGRHMGTKFQLDSQGNLFARTWTATTRFLSGFTGGVQIFLFDAAGNMVWKSPVRQFGVDARFVLFSRSARTDTWTETVPYGYAQLATSFEIVHSHEPTYWVAKTLFSSFIHLLSVFLGAGRSQPLPILPSQPQLGPYAHHPLAPRPPPSPCSCKK